MELEGIRRDKITPAYIEASKKWVQDTANRLNEGMSEASLEQEKNNIVTYIPKDPEAKLRRAKMEAVIKQELVVFRKEYPWYRVELPVFWNAYKMHPVGWDLIHVPDTQPEKRVGENFRNLNKECFEEILGYEVNMNTYL